MTSMGANVNRIGLTILYSPEQVGKCHEFDVVLVHGLFGHPKKTWSCEKPKSSSDYALPDVATTHETSVLDKDPPHKSYYFRFKKISSQTFWPRDLLPDVFPQARILTWGYDVQIERMFSSSSKASVFVHAETLLSDLVAHRSSVSGKEKPIVFIAHSLGGIVVKDALCMSRNENSFLNEILPATLGVMFLGTPHHGSNIASLAKIPFETTRLFFQKPNTKILRALEANSEVLNRITRSFGQLLATGQIKVHSFQEELDTKGIRIVDGFSSTIGYPEETRGTLYANHRDIAKFSSAKDVQFERLASVLRRWIDYSTRPQPVSNKPTRSDSKTPDLPDGSILDEQYQKCLRSLNVPEARDRIQDVQPPHAATYDWLFDTQVGFCDWLKGKHKTLTYWIYGKPGSGKSTLMKFAMEHPMTRESLKMNSNDFWIVAGYFFHDRGTVVQKSIEGFLRELLYQILRQRPDLFASMYSSFLYLDAPESVSLKDHRPTTLADTWNVKNLQEALFCIASKPIRDVNTCLFIDALDEHEGNHRELLSTLRRLTQISENSPFRLRLCLAGRPENIFKDEFQGCPGFAIHTYTTHDIRLYVEGRMQTGTNGRYTYEGEQEYSYLIAKIIEKAQGVFLWVRLVVDELIEGLCEGDCVEELESLLPTISTELTDLYIRAIRRIPRSSSLTVGKQRYEAYVMFQVAIYSLPRMSLCNFLAAASFLTTGRDTYRELQKLSPDQMQRRLNSRSAGLLEAPGSEEQVVQFIHQTAKEFIHTAEYELFTYEEIRNEPRENGYLLIFRYVVNILGHLFPDYHGTKAHTFAVRKFLQYAQMLEYMEQKGICACFEPVIATCADEEQHARMAEIVEYVWEEGGADAFATVHGRPEFRLLLFYAMLGLPLSLSQALGSHKACIPEDFCAKLLETALNYVHLYEGNSASRSFRVLEVLLEGGLGDRLSDKQFGDLGRRLETLLRTTHARRKNASSKRCAEIWNNLREQRSSVEAVGTASRHSKLDCNT